MDQANSGGRDGIVDATDARLAAQYESYPYPRRDPADEAKRLVVGSPSHLREIDHWVFGAARPASLPLEALVAGGGSGDGTIMLAQQLASAGRPGRVTYLDRSARALGLARARAERRGLTNIRFEQGSLLDLPGSGLGPFDYIDCCGVLHHLADPEAGLAALVAVLAPGGGLGLMVYAPHGRTGVCMVQEAMRLLTPEAEAPADRLDVAKRVMRNLPASNWLHANKGFADHLTGGDAGLYDLLLNPRDRAYDIPALARLVGSAGLRIACLLEPLRYDPALLLPDPKLRARIGGLDPLARAALAEALAGNMSTHVFYAVRDGDAVVAPDAMADGAVPVGREMPAAELAGHIRADGMLPFLFDGLRVPVPLPALAGAILRLIDARRSVGEIGVALAQRGVAPDAFRAAWAQSWAMLNGLNRLLLRPPG